jgi:hypothetical protein
VLTDFGEVGVRGGFGGHRRVTVGEGERAKAQVMATVTDGEAVGVVFACLRVTSLAAFRQDPVRELLVCELGGCKTCKSCCLKL